MEREVRAAKMQARQKAEANVWQSREEVGRTVRQAEAERVKQSQSQTEGGESPKQKARQGMAQSY